MTVSPTPSLPELRLPELRDDAEAVVRLGRELGRGGQGAVYLTEGQTAQVAKIYLTTPDEAQRHKLEALVAVRTPELEAVSAWPSTRLHGGGEVRGFLMPLVGAEYRELHSLYSPGSRRKHFPQADWAFLVHVARNVARAFATVHAAGHLMGDVSGRNVMVSPQGTVRLIDTDSFQVSLNGQTFPCPVGTAEFTPPELQGQGFGALIRKPDHDLFGVALLIFHLLFGGRHPYAGIHANGQQPSPAEAIAQGGFAYSRHPHPGVHRPPGILSLSALPPSMQDLFEQAFARTPGVRPSAATWERELAGLAGQLVTCEKNPQHRYFARVSSCPWCHLHGLIRRASPVTAGLLAGQKLDVSAELARLWAEVGQVRPPAASQPARLITAGRPLPALALNLPPRPQLSGEQATMLLLTRLLLRLAPILLLIALPKLLLGPLLTPGLILPVALLLALPLLVLFFPGDRRYSALRQVLLRILGQLETVVLRLLAPRQEQLRYYQRVLEVRQTEVVSNFFVCR